MVRVKEIKGIPITPDIRASGNGSLIAFGNADSKMRCLSLNWIWLIKLKQIKNLDMTLCSFIILIFIQTSFFH